MWSICTSYCNNFFAVRYHSRLTSSVIQRFHFPSTLNISQHSTLLFHSNNNIRSFTTDEFISSDVPPLPGKSQKNRKSIDYSQFPPIQHDSTFDNSSDISHDYSIDNIPPRTVYEPSKKRSRPMSRGERSRINSTVDAILSDPQATDSDYLDSDNLSFESTRSKYRNDKPLNRFAMKRLLQKKMKLEEEAAGPKQRLPSDLTISEPLDFTLSPRSIRPEGIEKVKPYNRRVSEFPLHHLKPVSEPGRQAAIQHDISKLQEDHMKLAASEEEVSDCWGCGATFQTTDPTGIGYIKAKFLAKFKLERRLYELKVESELSRSYEDDDWQPSPEMVEIESKLLSMEEMDDHEIPDTEPEIDRVISISLNTLDKKKKDKEAFQKSNSQDDKMLSQALKPPSRAICERCWTLRHQSRVIPANVSPEYFKSLLEPVKNMRTNPLIIKLVDIFDFHGSFIPNFRRYIGNKRIFIVATKMDLLPKGVHEDRVRAWVYKEAKKFGIEPVGVSLISGTSGTGIRKLADQIEHYRENEDVYIIGAANVGKSTLVNKMIDLFKGPTDRKATISPTPGTTLSFLALPIGKSSYMYDTPGIVTSRQVYHLLKTNDELKMTMPKKKIKPSVYRILPGTTLFLGGLGRLDYLDGPGLVYFTVFMSNEIYVHKTSTYKADQVYATKVGAMLTPPFEKESLQNWPGLEPYPDLIVEDPEGGSWQKASADVVFSGIGWISVTLKGKCKLRAWGPKDVVIGMREPLMPFESRLGVFPNPRLNLKPSSVAVQPRFNPEEEEVELTSDSL